MNQECLWNIIKFPLIGGRKSLWTSWTNSIYSRILFFTLFEIFLVLLPQPWLHTQCKVVTNLCMPQRPCGTCLCASFLTNWSRKHSLTLIFYSNIKASHHLHIIIECFSRKSQGWATITLYQKKKLKLKKNLWKLWQ